MIPGPSGQKTWQGLLLEAVALINAVPSGKLDLKVLVALNRLLVPATHAYRGQLRQCAGLIQLGDIIYRRLPGPVEAQGLAVEALNWLDEWLRRESASIAAVPLAAETLFLLMNAHPFMDGNGRVARAVATWIMLRSGYELKADPGAYMRERKHACYSAIALRQGLRGPWDPLPWNSFFDGLALDCYRAGSRHFVQQRR